MIRTTLWGAAIGMIVFALLGVYLNVSIGASPFANSGPVVFFAVIGGTLGGLLSPLIRRRPSKRARE